MSADFLGETKATADALALVGPDRAWSYTELEHAVDARAAAIRAGGVSEGRVVPLVVFPDVAGVVEVLALWRVGATPAPLSPQLTAPEQQRAREALRHAPVGGQVILWTSGTAGRPRGVEISADALRANAGASASRLGLGKDDVWLASLSPAHVGGLALIARSVLLGNALVAVGPFEAERAWALQHGRGLPPGADVSVSHMSVVPTQLLRLLEISGDAAPPASFRCVLVGGAGTPRRLLERALRAGWPVALTYGLTEATSQVATAPPTVVGRKPGTLGSPLAGVQIRIGSEDEILVRGATLASEYVGESPAPLVDDEGWHHTGDLGRIDEEGDLWVTGRRSDRIVSGGVTVDAVEVEEALRSHTRVADACVVGLPDDEWGERVAAWVEADACGVDARELDAYLRERLSAAKLPRRYHIGGALPRNANGKVDRNSIKAILIGGEGDQTSR